MIWGRNWSKKETAIFITLVILLSPYILIKWIGNKAWYAIVAVIGGFVAYCMDKK